MNIKTEYIFPPIPVRSFDWLAIDGNTYCCPECHSPVGYGATEQEAINDLYEIMADRQQRNMLAVPPRGKHHES